ncbi:hypothetical protein JRO89_XSUnG0040900 [Xanthoceras sorbifolium]|uniref:non-specific serine/threonine protein kinase n=1 Tax=Xanthoceras sorbifolium TaxID=99658 RepID=A0ABQ8GZY2_9ROSI|nr:hypothetical protein JRO89_XSUnG0040900 [Xanthoceras sorbifolium]
MMACKRTDLCISALLLIFNFFCSFDATDTITRTQYIFDIENSSVVSSDGNFKLGFFSPGKSQARYVGIWFNKISEHTVVWVANRGTPINNSSGVFKIGGDGNLAVFCGNEENPLWSTNVSVPKRTSIAKLLDSGNLVLVSENKWGETIIWQSFDHPTHVILPGEFSCGMDPHGLPQFFLYKNSVPRWRSGPWTGRIVNGLPDVATKYRGHNVVDYSNPVALISTTFVNNKDEIYITFSPKNGALFPIGVIDPTGMRQRLVWHESQKWVKLAAVPQDLCDEYDRCGANAICNEDSLARCTCLPGFESLYPQDWYIKCVETRKMEGCGKGDGEGFVRMEGVKLPDARNSTVYGNMSLEECERECLKNCNCTGFATLYVDERGLGCVAWYGELRDVRHYKDGQDFYIRVDAVDLAADARKNSKHFLPRKSTLAFIIVPVIVEMLLAALCFQYLWRKNAKTKGDAKLPTWELWSDGKALEIVDSCIVDSCSTNDILRCIHVGLLCVQDDASDRPSMSSVVFMLSNETVLPSPKKSMFAFKKNGPGSAIIERECSLNELMETSNWCSSATASLKLVLLEYG